MGADVFVPEENNEGGEGKTKKNNKNSALGPIIGAFIFLILLCAFLVYLTTADSVRKSTTELYQGRMLDLKTNHQEKEQNTIEIYEDALKECRLKSEHSVRMFKARQIGKKDKVFHAALITAIMELQPKVDEMTSSRIANLIMEECRANKLDPVLVTALIWVESRFDILAHSRKGAVGLMQVRYKTWKETPVLKGNGVNAKYRLYWVDLNIKCGTEILAKYYKEAKGNMAKALYRYNTGSKNLPEDKSVTDIEYINRIMLTAYEISDSMRKGKNGSVEEP